MTEKTSYTVERLPNGKWAVHYKGRPVDAGWLDYSCAVEQKYDRERRAVEARAGIARAAARGEAPGTED